MNCTPAIWVGASLVTLGFFILALDLDRVRAQIDGRDTTPRRVAKWLSRSARRVSANVRHIVRRVLRRPPPVKTGEAHLVGIGSAIAGGGAMGVKVQTSRAGKPVEERLALLEEDVGALHEQVDALPDRWAADVRRAEERVRSDVAALREEVEAREQERHQREVARVQTSAVWNLVAVALFVVGELVMAIGSTTGC